jgi:drug/metabolite transporter (DMT)-like permease
MKDSSIALNELQIAALRIFSAGLVFVPFAVFHIAKIPVRKLGVVIFSAVMGNLLPAFLFAAALTKIDGSLAGILNSLTPICVVIIGILFFKTKIQKQKMVGVLTGFIGLVLLTLIPAFIGEKNISVNNIGYTLMIVLATLFYGFNVNMIGHYMKGINAIYVATVSLAFMVIPTGLVLWQQHFFELNFSNPDVQHSVMASAGLGIVGSAIATALFYVLVQKAGGLFASLVTYGIPFIALFWGVIDGEKITVIEIGCLGIILSGVYLANLPDRKKGKTEILPENQVD